MIGVVNASLDFIGNSPEGVNFPLTKSPIELHARQDPWQLTCGFKSDNPSEPRIAASGWYCATDKTFNYWGVGTTQKLKTIFELTLIVLSYDYHSSIGLPYSSPMPGRTFVFCRMWPSGLELDIFMVVQISLGPEHRLTEMIL